MLCASLVGGSTAASPDIGEYSTAGARVNAGVERSELERLSGLATKSTRWALFFGGSDWTCGYSRRNSSDSGGLV